MEASLVPSRFTLVVQWNAYGKGDRNREWSHARSSKLNGVGEAHRASCWNNHAPHHEQPKLQYYWFWVGAPVCCFEGSHNWGKPQWDVWTQFVKNTICELWRIEAQFVKSSHVLLWRAVFRKNEPTSVFVKNRVVILHKRYDARLLYHTVYYMKKIR